MKRTFSALALLALAACTPPQQQAHQSAEAVVESIYETARQHVGQSVKPADSIPMTDNLRALLNSAEAEAAIRNEPFIEGDLALNCQDCTTISDLVVGPQTGPYREPTVDGHEWVQASFTLNRDEPRTILYDMARTPDGWRVDNILADGFDLRNEARLYLEGSE